MYASDSPSPLVKFELNDSEVDEMPKDEVKVEVKKPHKFIYPRLNFFGSGSSNVVADSSAALPQLSPARSAVTSQLKNDGSKSDSKKSPYTFFTVDSDDDFDPYGSDVPSDVDTKRELLLSHGLGMISHKKSPITIFGQKHKIKNFIIKFDIFHEKISTAFRFWLIFGIKLLILKQNYIIIISKFWTKWQL